MIEIRIPTEIFFEGVSPSLWYQYNNYFHLKIILQIYVNTRKYDIHKIITIKDFLKKKKKKL